ncbi:hypothetical protein Pfo_024928 [Paulownia fortunei]|nr:hypothetical protein Pfo_024928 [Paulownia fortunei]
MLMGVGGCAGRGCGLPGGGGGKKGGGGETVGEGVGCECCELEEVEKKNMVEMVKVMKKMEEVGVGVQKVTGEKVEANKLVVVLMEMAPKRQFQASRRLVPEEVVIICKIHQIWKLTYPDRDLPRHHVVCHIQLLQAVHISNAIRNTSFKLIVGHNYDRHRRVADVLRQGRRKSIIVYKNCIKFFLKEYFRLGNSRISSGNLPANRLLLRSNSNRSFKFTKLWGILPQNRFEFK